MRNLIQIRRNLKKTIKQYYDSNTLLWVMSNITIKHIGMNLLRYNYNLHLFELIDSLYYFGKNPLFKINIRKLCLNANNVIVCEFNRACITQTWFQLKELPLIISNKPAPNEIEKQSSIIHDINGEKTIRSLANKKIILYQGLVDKERPVEIISQAIEDMSDEFVFLVMTGSNCAELQKYKKTVVISYIMPPYHLEVTSHAYIGVLIYTPVYGQFSSPLNSVYCAPNKLYEYSQFSLPMIGNNIPGLKYSIEYNHMGICVDKLDKEQIINAISVIDKEYSQMSSNSKKFFEEASNDLVIDAAIKR